MKIFRSSTGKLVELNENSFSYEAMIQKLVENNLKDLFPSLEFVRSEYQLEDLRPDSIAFDVDARTFVIIEYKNVRDKSVVDQGMSYYQLLQEHKESFVLLYNKIKGKLFDVGEINWDETRVIFISPSFTPYQRRASGYSGAPVELYEIKKYGDEIITLAKVESGGTTSTVAPLRTKLTRAPVSITEYDEEDYLAGKYDAPEPVPEIRRLFYDLKKAILENFKDLETRQKKQYHGIYSKDDGSSVCTLEVRKQKIILTYSTHDANLVPPSEFIRDVSKIGHWGIGSFQSEIKSESDIAKAIPFIRKVYESK